MIFQPIKRRWARREIKKSINNRQVRYDGSLEKVLLICRVDEVVPDKLHKTIAKGLELSPSKISLVVCDYKKKDTEESSYMLFNEKLFKIFGGLRAPNFKDLLSESYDVQINYFKGSSLELEYVATVAKTSLKVGIGNQSADCSDLNIDVKLDEAVRFTSELKKYLKIIK